MSILGCRIFLSLKRSWEKNLTRGKRKLSKSLGFQKHEFSNLLKQTLESMDKIIPKTKMERKVLQKETLWFLGLRHSITLEFWKIYHKALLLHTTLDALLAILLEK